MGTVNPNIELTKKKIVNEYGVTLFQIRAKKTFSISDYDEIEAGTHGGFTDNIELLQDSSWLYPGAQLWGSAILKGHSSVEENSVVFGNVTLEDTTIWNEVVIKGNGSLKKSSIGSGSIINMKPHSLIDNTNVSSRSTIIGRCTIADSWISGAALIDSSYLKESRINGGIFENVALEKAILRSHLDMILIKPPLLSYSANTDTKSEPSESPYLAIHIGVNGTVSFSCPYTSGDIDELDGNEYGFSPAMTASIKELGKSLL